MYELTLESLLVIATDLPDGLLVVHAPDDDINNIRLVFANRQSALSSNFPFPALVGLTIQEIYQSPMEDADFAQAWMRVAQTGKPEKLVVKYGSDVHPFGVFNVLMYNAGNRRVATLYRNITVEHNLQQELDRVNERLQEVLDKYEDG